jgi:hypothetical protein
MDNSTEFAVFVLEMRTRGLGRDRIVHRRLMRYSALNPKSGDITRRGEFAPGMGIAGQAFRSRKPIMFNTTDDGSGELYWKTPDQDAVHQYLYCAPLHVPVQSSVSMPGVDPISSGASLIYAVLCIGSYDPSVRIITT